MKFIPGNSPRKRVADMTVLAGKRISCFKDRPRHMERLNPLILADICELFVQGMLSASDRTIFAQACIESVMVNRVLNRAFDAARWEKTAAGQEWVRKIEYRLVA